MSDMCDIWQYPLQGWWRTVNEMSNFMHKGEIGNFIFCPVVRVQQFQIVTQTLCQCCEPP